VELLQTRHEKDILRQNRIAYEKQLEIRRRQDFIEAMDREAVDEKQEILFFFYLLKIIIIFRN
jgi:hypothetical protein